MLRKLLIALALCVPLAAPLAIDAAPAFANNCTVTPDPPGFSNHPPTQVQTSTQIYCDTNFYLKWTDTIFLGGEAYTYTSLVATAPAMLPAYWVGLMTHQLNCPIGGDHWWGHWTRYWIKWQGQSSYGPPHDSVASGGIYGHCT